MREMEGIRREGGGDTKGGLRKGKVWSIGGTNEPLTYSRQGKIKICGAFHPLRMKDQDKKRREKKGEGKGAKEGEEGKGKSYIVITLLSFSHERTCPESMSV